ncbi:MAG: arginine--tRNA ligase [Candidatus Babeliales bacterium]
MNPIAHIQNAFASYLQKTFGIGEKLAQAGNFILNVDPNKQEFGDMNANAAMVFARELKQNPRAIAHQIASEFKHPYVAKIEIAGPGFLNAYFTPQAIQDLAKDLADKKESFFQLDQDTPKHRYDIEFVSANPTGPLHLGHGRGAIIGDVLAKVLTFLGHQVTKEFYINDAGNQINKLGISFKIRCQQAAGIQAELPEDGYRGEYLLELAQDLIKTEGASILQKPDSFFEHYAKEFLLNKIQQTLEDYGVTFDVWFSEKTLHEGGHIERAIKILQEHNFIYERENALWFASTKFGDDKDRVVKKSSGEWTYAAADIAYLLNKAKRGFDHLVMVLGHDHHSYAVRLEGIRQALNLSRIHLSIILYQLVTMKASGQLVQMSKRAGTMITLHDVIDEVGKDVARFFYLNRKADAQLEFDLDLALKKTEENPVFYVQYAYVRTGSILEKATEYTQLAAITNQDAHYLGSAESLLIKKIAALKHLLETIAATEHTHLLTYYTIELADLLHRYYAQNRVIDTAHIQQSRARLFLIQLVRETFATTFDLLGISKPAKM